METQPPLKVYILLKDNADVGHAVNCAAHASLALYLRHSEDPDVVQWVTESFRKVSCKVTPEQFAKAKTYGLGHEVIFEKGLPDPEVAIAFLPRRVWPEFFKSLKLYR